jgi:hypothetical protein
VIGVGCGIAAVLLTFVAFAVPSEFLDRAARIAGSPGAAAAHLMLVNPSDPKIADQFSIVFITGNIIFYAILAVIIANLGTLLTTKLSRESK